MTGDKITVGAPYFNQAFLPVFGIALMFAAVDRYGDYVLLEPTKSAKDAVLWLTPAAALLMRLLGITLYLRRRNTPQAVAVMSDEDRAAARQLLQGGQDQ